jgi:hypothetical protein
MAAMFSLGQLVATPGAITALADAGQTPGHFLSLHESGSWGDLCAEDRAFNERAIAEEGNLEKQSRVFSTYRTRNNVKLYVITEWDRSVTTILLPDEY